MSIPIQVDQPTTSTTVDIEPIDIELIQMCRFKAKQCNVCGKAKSNPAHAKKALSTGGHAYSSARGCAKCGKLKKDTDHVDLAASLNILGDGDRFTYRAQKEALEEAFAYALEASGLARGLFSVMVECTIWFGDLKDRDEGNIAFFIEKALGDVLVKGYGYSTGSKKKNTYEWHQVIDGGWLPKDSFYPVRHYTFGNIQPHHDESVITKLRLTLFPSF